MAVDKFNYTGRLQIALQDIDIEFTPGESEFTLRKLDLSSPEYSTLPKEASVHIEPYVGNQRRRIDLGKVADFDGATPTSPSNHPLEGFVSTHNLKFRLKVTSQEDGKTGLLLAVADQLNFGGHESLLPIEPDDQLDQESWRLEFEGDDGPVLRINSEYFTDWHAAVASDQFVGLVYPAVLNLVLTEYLHQHFKNPVDMEDPDSVVAEWLRFGESEANSKKPDENDGEQAALDWIENAVKGFSERIKAATRAAIVFKHGDGA